MRRVRPSDAGPAEDPDDPEGFRARMDRFGPRLGAEHTGASLYEPPPGQALCPYHYERASGVGSHRGETGAEDEPR